MRDVRAEDQHFAALMQAAQGGDGGAYAQLLSEIAPRLRRFVQGHWRVPGAEDVEDLVQDVLLSVHAVRATYDPSRPFMPWLFAIARNRIADGSRRRARHEGRQLQIENWDVTFSGEGANSSTEVFGEVEALSHAIQALPAGQRSAIEMLKLKEMSLKEAAAASGMSIGSLKVATHRAMTALRKRLLKQE
jgi:RNA polymerase sigma factor (sigma-70 family)